MNEETNRFEVDEPQFKEETVTQTPPVVKRPEIKREETIVETPSETIVDSSISFEEEKVFKNEWEVKDRMYLLHSKKKPLSFLIKSSGIYWFDEEKGYERELKYCKNQRTVFVDEMKGDQILSHIIFRNGN